MYKYGYSYNTSTSSDDASAMFSMVVLCIVAIIVFIAWLVATNKLVKLAMEKDPTRDTTGVLWFIGICASPIVLGLYVCALPDTRALSQSKPEGDKPSNLPSI